MTEDTEHGFQPCGHPWTDIDNAVCDGFCTGCAKDDELAMEREGREERFPHRNAQRVGEPMGSDKPRLDPRVAEEIAKATMPEGRFASETIRAYNETQQLIANKDRQGLAEALARDARDFSETTHKSSDAINSGIPNEPELSVSQEWLDGYRHGYAESKLDTTESLTHRGSGYHAPKINPHSLTPPTPGLNGARQTNTPRMEQ